MMTGLINVKNNFDEAKEYLIEILINYYGQEYSEIIKERLKCVFFDFSSTPKDDRDFLIFHRYNIDEESKLLLESRYREFKKVSDETTKEKEKLLMSYLKNNFTIENINESNEEHFITLFTENNLNTSYIDAFSTKSIDLLNNPNTAKSIKDSILYDQDTFKRILRILQIKIEELSPTKVDQIINYREKLQIDYKTHVLSRTEFGRKKIFRLESELKTELSYEDITSIASIAFRNYPCAIIIQKNEPGSLYYHVVKIPIVYLMNLGLTAIDVVVIHEMIHMVETNGWGVGISYHKETGTEINEIANEIRTQKLAIKIANEMHKLGLFIFDDPHNFSVEGSTTYEALFPLVGDFFDKYEKIFSDCAINTMSEKLYELFGKSWAEFSKELDTIYSKHMHFYSKKEKIMDIDSNNDYISKLIDDMESYKKRGVKSV